MLLTVRSLRHPGRTRDCVRRSSKPDRPQPEGDDKPILNPVELGRRSRQALDGVWYQMTRMTSSRSSFSLEDDLGADFSSVNFETPQASFTSVLVVGGTGRVGRIVVRKLLLRGYSVRVMARDSEGTAAESLPSNVELVRGDVGNLADCRRAVSGMDKVIYCAASKLDLSADFNKVESQGVSYVARTFIDAKFAARNQAARAPQPVPAFKASIVDFSKEDAQDEWDVLAAGPADGKEQGYKGQDFATALISEDSKRLCFTGAVYSRTGIVEWGGPIAGLGDSEGIVFQVLADGKPYFCVMVDSEGRSYAARFNTRTGFNNVRLATNMFRPETPGAPPLDPARVTLLKFRFDKAQIPVDASADVSVMEERRVRNAFSFEICYVKSLPINDEPAVVLISCAGTAADENARRLGAKRRGETALRNSGLGYTIVRPGPLIEEAGGYKAMVFDQGDRIDQGIGFADVADICLRALHATEAVNKTFEVCYEYAPEGGLTVFELVAHMPDRANNYLQPALATLERNI